jgi:hypothetical protein
MASNILFPRASFLLGAARTFDLWGHLDVYNYSRTPDEADAIALYSDWRVVGEDLFDSVVLYGWDPQQLELFPSKSEVQLKRASSE